MTTKVIILLALEFKLKNLTEKSNLSESLFLNPEKFQIPIEGHDSIE